MGFFSEIKSKMKYFKVLLPFLAISNGQEDGEEEDRQCVNCEQASVLILGGQAANGNNYEAVGYEFLQNFFIEKYELGTFTADWVQIQDDFVFPNEPNDEFCSSFYSQVSTFFESANPSGYKTLVCQGSDICLPIESCLRIKSDQETPFDLLLEMGFVSSYVTTMDVEIFSVIAEYDGYYTIAEQAKQIAYLETFVPFPSNFHMLKIDHSNARKWSDATIPYPFIYEDDIDTKSRRTTTFRRMVRALTNFIDSDNVGIRRNTQGARDWGKMMTSNTNLENTENRRLESLAQAVQQRIITEIGNENYNKLIDHTYVDDISTVTQFKDTFYLHIFSQVVKYQEEQFKYSAGSDVAREYWMKIFNPDGTFTCLDIQNELIYEVLNQLTGKQLSFYSVHGCEIIGSTAQIFTDINEWTDSKAEMYMESGFMNIGTAQFTDNDELNCKIISPARIMQWILSDAHRYQNLKACHEYIGKKPCQTCPSDE